MYFSTTAIGTTAIILSLIFIDIFCADVTNTRQNNQPTVQNSSQILPNGKSTTPWPSIRQRWTEHPNPQDNIRSMQQNPRNVQRGSTKWTQQNNIWIRNEQQASGGGQPSVGASVSPRNKNIQQQNSMMQTNGQQALLNGLGGSQQSLVPTASPQNKNTPTLPNPTPKPQTIPSTLKPMSYAGVVAPKNPPGSPPVAPKTNAGGAKKEPLPSSTGPTENPEAESSKNQHDDSGATDDELRDFAEMLLRKDVNNAMKHVTLNVQGMTSSRSSKDEAPQPLLTINSEAFKIPSIQKVMVLYNNYFLDAGQNEVYTGQERIEENDLLDTILATPVMQLARSFLVQKGKIGKDPKEFKDLLRLIWFNMYSRGGGRIGSSGFEHIFVAEIKNNQVSGLHNWLFFNEEESQNRANYLGYLKKIDLGEKGAILKYHFTFHDIDKPVGSMFIGTSPELEMALYSTCFVLRPDRICPLKMNGNRFIIRTYTYRYRGKNMIGSAFPEI